jgi:hypothetical protein
MADTFGLVTEYIKRIGASRRNEANPVDPKGNPISDIMQNTNRYGAAIPTMALQQFAPDTPNAKTFREGRGSVYYSAKEYDNLPQSTIQTLRLLADEVTNINSKVNHMIRLRGEKAYEIVSGYDDTKPDDISAINDLRRTAIARRDYASSMNGWIAFILSVVLAVWVFTVVYLALNGGTGSILQNVVKYMNLVILPAAMLLLIFYGYIFIPGYGITLPSPGPSANQFS